jgi:hypothetical protein
MPGQPDYVVYGNSIPPEDRDVVTAILLDWAARSHMNLVIE